MPRKIRTQFLIWFLLIAIIPLLVIVLLFSPKVADAIEHKEISHFKALAFFQVQKLEHFRDHIISDLRNLAGEREIVEPLINNTLNYLNSKDLEYSHAIKEQFKSFYERLFYENSDYFVSEFLLIDELGQILFSANGSLNGKIITDIPAGDIHLSESYLNFVKSKELYISGTVFDNTERTPAIVIFMPVFHRNEFIGSFAKVINLTRILSDLASDELLGESGEMLVGQRFGDSVVFISPPRFAPTDACQYKIPLGSNKALPIQEAIQGRVGSAISIDYRGEKVIADWEFVSGVDWGIVIKMDYEELLAPVNKMRKRLYYFIMLIIIITVFSSLIFSYTIARPIIKLKEALNKVGRGDLHIQLQNHQNDEIGDLNIAFNAMINNLRTITISRNKLNEEIKNRIKAEERVSLLTNAIENSPIVKFITNKNGIITYVNQKFIELTGYTKEDAIGNNPRLLSSGHHSKSFYEEMWSNLLNKGYWRGELLDKKKNGDFFWLDVSISAIRDEKQKITHFVSAQMDITETKHMQEELEENTEILEKSRKAALNLMQDAHQQQEETQKTLLKLEDSQKELRKLSLAIEQSPITVLITDDKGHIEYVNPYFTVATGYTLEEVKGIRGILKSSNHHSATYENLWTTIKSGVTWRGEFQNKKKNGELYWESATISPIFSKDKQITNYIAIKEDITIKKALEANATNNRLRLLRHQDALNTIAQGNVFINPDFKLAIQELTKQAATGLDLERASLWLFTDKKKNKLRAINIYHKSKDKHYSDIELDEKDYRAYFKAIKNQQINAANDAMDDERTREFSKNYLVPNKIFSMLDVSVTIDGEVVGVVCHEAVGKRKEWSIEEENFARSISDFVALIISNKNRRKAQETLENFTQLQQLVSSMASRFIYIPFRDLDNEIENSLMLLVQHMQMDGAVITRSDKTGASNFVVSHSWLGSGLQLFENQTLDLYPQLTGCNDNKNNEHFRLFSYKETSKGKGEQNKNFLYKIGVRSGLSLPIKNKLGTYSGSLCFLSTSNEINLTKSEINLLTSLCTILENAFLHKEKEEQLILEKEKAEAATVSKSVFLANMSHEIRTPLNAVLGFSEILSRLVDQPAQIEYLSSIRSSGKTLLELINDILDLSKIEAGKLRLQKDAVNIKELLTEIRSLFSLKAADKGLELRIIQPDTFPKYIELDELRLKQVIINLVGNAIKFTDEGYVQLVIKINTLRKDSIDFEISVKDSGIGISEHYKKQIFEAFEQQEGQDNRKYGGTGLGLAITHKIVKMMGGRIQIQTKVDKGSQFKILLNKVPLSFEVQDEQPVEDILDPDQIDFSYATVLVVDDILENRSLIKGFLLPYKIKLIEAENGSEALEKVNEHKPDFVFMDIRMPVMDGVEAFKIIKSNPETSHIPIVALTASVFKRDESDTKENSFDDFVKKPATLQDVIEVMSRFIPFSIRNKKATVKNYFSSLSPFINPKLYSQLELDVLPILAELQKIRPKKKVLQLADIILKLGEEFNDKPFILYAQDLRKANINFNVEREKELIVKFPILFKLISKTK
jgi:PAS domain S-box-containing protein